MNQGPREIQEIQKSKIRKEIARNLALVSVKRKMNDYNIIEI